MSFLNFFWVFSDIFGYFLILKFQYYSSFESGSIHRHWPPVIRWSSVASGGFADAKSRGFGAHLVANIPRVQVRLVTSFSCERNSNRKEQAEAKCLQNSTTIRTQIVIRTRVTQWREHRPFVDAE